MLVLCELSYVPVSVSGCAFLTFVHRESAEKAMEQLHGKRVLPGVSVRGTLSSSDPCTLVARCEGQGLSH